jgi:hypothetical protein
MRTRIAQMAVAMLFVLQSLSAADNAVNVQETDAYVEIETDALKARIVKQGYVSGVAAGTLVDKRTGAHDLGFGLHIMDFLLGPGWADDGYLRDEKLHGNLPKHYVEGPQICTQAKRVDVHVTQGDGFVAVQLRWKFTQPHAGFKAGSQWEQTLVFQPGLRYFLSCERITSVNTVENVFYRIDMPGHVKHNQGDTFEQIYLSYHGRIPAAEFSKDFGPDARFLYQRKEGQIPDRFIRAYQVKLDGKPGPWLAGMTLNPIDVSEAWCHERGYICFIEELYGRAVKEGESFGAAYAVGWFDDIAAMEKTYDQLKGTTSIKIENGKFELVR